MTDLSESTVDAAYTAYWATLDEHGVEPRPKAAMEAALQAALDEGGVVPRSQFANVCDYLLAWTGFNEYCLVNVTTMDQLVPKFKHDALREAAQAVLPMLGGHALDSHWGERVERLRRELK